MQSATSPPRPRVRRRRPVINVTVPADVDARARALAASKEVTLSEIASRALLAYLEREAQRGPEQRHEAQEGRAA